MFQGLLDLALVAVPQIRIFNGKLLFGEAGLARAGFSQDREVFSVQRAIR